MTAATFYRLPDTFSTWPWPRRVNPHAEEVIAKSADWLRTFHAFGPESQRIFDKFNVGLGGALTYPFASRELLRVGCDLFNLLFVYDHYTDVENMQGCRTMAEITMDALKNPHTPRPHGEVSLGEIARQFWMHAIDSSVVGPVAQRRFIDYFTAYTQAVIDEAADRDTNARRQLDDYFALRRDTLGFRPLYALMVLELPDEVVHHPAMIEMEICVIDMLIIDNDIISYNREQRTGIDGHNLVTLTMLKLGLSIHDAIAHLSRQHADLRQRFMKAYKSIELRWDATTNEQLQRTLRDLAHFPRGIYCWHFESERYFGTKGAEVSTSRNVEILPRASGEDLRQENVVLLEMDSDVAVISVRDGLEGEQE